MQAITVEGGRSPWTGPQSFVITVPAAKATLRVTVDGRSVVAADGGRGHAVARQGHDHPADRRALAGRTRRPKAMPRSFSRWTRSIGKEVTKQIGEGQILDDHSVRPQVLVRRGEIITVYARTAGIQVRVSARSRDEGAMGDLVTVESLTKRETYFARVTGPQACDVFAHAITTVEDVAARPANAERLAAAKRAATRSSAVPVSSNSKAIQK